MAGVRLGYCLSSNAKLLGRMKNAGQPWAVSSLAQAAGLAALREDAYVARARALVKKERAFLLEALKLPGIELLGGEANFLFFRTAISDLTAKLPRAGLLIRDCSNYHGLSGGYYRIAVRTHAENRKLVEALRRALTEQV
jgi:threonine-phosphate decarboxylase